MLYTKLTRSALEIAYNAHHGQTDKTGLMYIYHPLHLAEHIGDDEDLIATALLHDVVEDTSLTFDDLKASGINENVISALKLLTHDEGIPYMSYIQAIIDSGNHLAIKVKMADLVHNSDTWRLLCPEPEALARIEKYKAAYKLFIDNGHI